ncbi:MAG: FG-GAP-like repeat-containing protein, partial [Candidatus Omnitrophica bacterium]|nr:FG-GAP-like repeat-containing protein [Candidatus Omnitrophota bacterium]
VGDVMGTGSPQIIVATCAGEIHIFDSVGNLVKKLPDRYRSSYGVNPNVAVADIDMDGKNEMVITADMTIYVVNRDGEKWSKELFTKREPGENCLFQPTVADLDGDGEKEIIVQTMFYGNQLYVLDCKGNILKGWPKTLCARKWYCEALPSAPIAADVDKDGILEILTTSTDNDVHVFKPDGSYLPGWPLKFDIYTVWMFGQITVGDLDNDGTLEIVLGGVTLFNDKDEYGIHDMLYIFRPNGKIYSNKWPIYDTLSGVGESWGFRSPILADVNNDGLSEIIVTGAIDPLRGDSFHVYDLTGCELADFHKPISGITPWPANCPAVGDIVGNGKNQILWLNHGYIFDWDENRFHDAAYYSMYLWDTDASSTSSKPWSMFHRDPQHTGVTPTSVVSPFKAPSDLRIVANTSTMVTLAWTNNSPLTTDFEIERKAEGGTYALIDEVKVKNTTYKDKKAVSGAKYYYRVRAVRKDVYRSKYSNEALATPLLPGPSVLAATAVSSTQINLSWTDNSIDEKKFCIERKTDANGAYAEIHRSAANKTSYSDKTVVLGKTYYYRVRAINKKGVYSEYSNEANATTLLPAPSGLTATTVSKSSINLYWKDNAGDAKNFLIERKTGAKGTYAQIAKTGPKDTDYKNNQLVRGTTYYYRVRVINKKGYYSGYSNEASATTKAK